jgi:predicted RNase H-like HicB family nuclease
MKQKFLVIYERMKHNYGGFAPDILGAVSTGKNLHEMRRMMKECLEFHLEGTAEAGEPMPQPLTTSSDFAEIRDYSVDHYVVEWLEIEVPDRKTASEEVAV